MAAPRYVDVLELDFELREAGSVPNTFILMGEPREDVRYSGDALMCLDGDFSMSCSFIGLERMLGEPPCRGLTP